MWTFFTFFFIRFVLNVAFRLLHIFSQNAMITKRFKSKYKNLFYVAEEKEMSKALVIIDIQNDITKNYRDILENLNQAIERAAAKGMQVVYIQHNNLSAGTRTFKPGTRGAELVPELKIVTENIFVKTKSNALTSEVFAAFIEANGIDEFYLAGADAAACVKSTSFNMAKAGYRVHVLSDCITSYDKSKIAGLLEYYQSKGCFVETLDEALW